MRTVVAGLGIQGVKRVRVAGPDVVATVDPVNPAAQYKNIRDIPLDAYDSVLVCTPDHVKFELLNYLLSNGKHVLVEKPLLAGEGNLELEELARIARKNRVACYTAYNHRFEPHIVNLKNVIDSGELGRVYMAKFFYGNGTARDVRNSVWRDKGDGVLPDLGSHLLDMTLFLFGDQAKQAFEPWAFNRFENLSFDHFIFSGDGAPHLQLEGTLLSWRNTFRADVFAEKGSAHIDCLCKWGPSVLTVRNRVLPSGRPAERVERLEMQDPTWVAEYDYFKKLCTSGTTNLENDIWINSVLNGLGKDFRK